MTDSERGAFIWYELMTDDPAAARDFYRAVVGWEIEAEGQAMPTGSSYRMIGRSDGGFAGGALEITPDMKAGGASPGWLGYIHHPDVDGAVSALKNAGGTVHMPPPADNPDATSDVFSVDQAQHMRWNELWTTDPDAAVSLYTDLFGWTQEGAMPMGPRGDYLFIQNDDVGIGAIGKAQADGEGSRWQFFAGVDDIDRACKAVTENGGKLLGDPQQIPGGEYSVYAHDPQGATIGLVGPRN